MISGSNDTIRSWHPGDRDIEDMEQFYRENPELKPKMPAGIKGPVMVFGTGGDLNNLDGLEELFMNPESYNSLPQK